MLYAQAVELIKIYAAARGMSFAQALTDMSKLSSEGELGLLNQRAYDTYTQHFQELA